MSKRMGRERESKKEGDMRNTEEVYSRGCERGVWMR